MQTPFKFIWLNLRSISGDEFAIIRVFKETALRQGWDEKEIDSVLNAAIKVANRDPDISYKLLFDELSLYCRLPKDNEEGFEDFYEPQDIQYDFYK